MVSEGIKRLAELPKSLGVSGEVRLELLLLGVDLLDLLVCGYLSHLLGEVLHPLSRGSQVQPIEVLLLPLELGVELTAHLPKAHLEDLTDLLLDPLEVSVKVAN